MPYFGPRPFRCSKCDWEGYLEHGDVFMHFADNCVFGLTCPECNSGVRDGLSDATIIKIKQRKEDEKRSLAYCFQLISIAVENGCLSNEQGDAYRRYVNNGELNPLTIIARLEIKTKTISKKNIAL